MKILLLGYGKMGEIIEQIAIDRGHTISAKISSSNRDELDHLKVDEIDVAIEFSQPEAAFDNILYCLKNNIPVLSGTTGWLERMKDVEQLCNDLSGTFFYASNFSIGVNLFFKLNEQLAQIMDNFESYDVEIDETHHIHKKDAPSGTAITLAEGVIKHIDRVKEWQLDKKQPGGLKIMAYREDEVPGTHSVKYRSAIDDIEIKHTAHSRAGFAKGAVMVAEWLKDKKGVLSMDDFLKS
ncbi:MAG: 4-hydroxy-tetrahydrodipicolinate reductase [Fulvivirga sp.]